MKSLITILLLTLAAAVSAHTTGNDVGSMGNDNVGYLGYHINGSIIGGVPADTLTLPALADSSTVAPLPMFTDTDTAAGTTHTDSTATADQYRQPADYVIPATAITVGTAAAIGAAATTGETTATTYTESTITTSSTTVTSSDSTAEAYTFPRGAWDLSLQPRPHQVAIFCGAELNYADRNFLRLYDVLLNLTPGVKWHIGNDFMLAGQIHVPVANYGYGERMSMIRLNMTVLSKQLHFTNAHQHFKFSAGLFNRERMGADIKWMWPVNRWLLFMAQAGVTGHWALGVDFKGNHEETFGKDWLFTGIAGARFYLEKWETEFVLSGGRYLNKRMGAQLEIMRHFTYCTVGIYGQIHQKDPSNTYSNHTEAGGFKVVMMIPPYKRSKRKVAFRPASNFRLTYNAQSDGISMKMYDTDPEDNERQYPIDVNWGAMRKK